MDIQKIISGGSLGAESAALDVAIRLKIPYGGFATEGSLITGDHLTRRYALEEAPFEAPEEQIRANLTLSDAALVISHGRLSPPLHQARTLADQRPLPWLHIDLDRTPPLQAAFKIHLWFREKAVLQPYISGSRLEEDAHIYQESVETLYSALMLGKEAYPAENTPPAKRVPLPRTVDEAVAFLIRELPLKDKVTIANMTADELVTLNQNLGNYIRKTFGLWNENRQLLWSCSKEAGKSIERPEDASSIIIAQLAIELEKTHKLRPL
jgi:hypothetical protein